MHRIRALLVISLALLGALTIAACGGDDGGGGDENPQTLLDATFSNDEKVTSGVFDLSVDVNSEGGTDAGTFKGTLGGPFQSEEGAFPKFDIDAEVTSDSESQDFSGTAGLTSTGDKAFVSFQDSNYEVPADAFSEFAQTFTEAQSQNSAEGGNLLESIGVNPSNWLTDLSNEGNEDVEGTETIHISGTADTPKLVEDIKKIAENTPEVAGQKVAPEQLSQLDQLTGIIESAEFDIFTGADDNLLRKLEANLKLNPPDSEGAPESVDVTFAITLRDLNQAQEIAAPADAQPLGDLLQQFGVDPSQLGQLGAGGAGGGGADAGAVPPAGGSPQGPSDSASAAYLECLRTAQGDAAVQECNSLLQ